jgi:hypothetical protein
MIKIISEKNLNLSSLGLLGPPRLKTGGSKSKGGGVKALYFGKIGDFPEIRKFRKKKIWLKIAFILNRIVF